MTRKAQRTKSSSGVGIAECVPIGEHPMGLFLAWSGSVSRQVAEAFRPWLKCVVKGVDPFLSTLDIDKGSDWHSALVERLKACSFGILFLTRENLASPWMHFEAGALLKQIGPARICPFLFNVSDAKLIGPFSLFQAARFQQDDIHQLVRSINKSLPQTVPDAVLEKSFEDSWPSLEERLAEIARGEHPAFAEDPRSLNAEQFRDIALELLGHDSLHALGMREAFRTRLESLRCIREEIEAEAKEIVIVGSSLKGLIGVGGESQGDRAAIRIALLDALKRNVRVRLLLTHPEVAHHRSKQEGRERGEIEREILENLIYFVSERSKNSLVNANLEIKLYNGTPTIFMVATSRTMFFNPYTLYSKAFQSLCFRVAAGSPIYDEYVNNHYLAAWSDSFLTQQIKPDVAGALEQLRTLIGGLNQHNQRVIPDIGGQRLLLEALAGVRGQSAARGRRPKRLPVPACRGARRNEA